MYKQYIHTCTFKLTFPCDKCPIQPNIHMYIRRYTKYTKYCVIHIHMNVHVHTALYLIQLLPAALPQAKIPEVKDEGSVPG